MRFRCGLWLTGVVLLPGFIHAQCMAGELAGEVLAEERVNERVEFVVLADADSHADAAHDFFSGAQKADLAILDTQRGGADTVLNDIRSDGVVSGNQAYNLNTGANSIANGAFVGANGFSTVVQNSGNNVLIQNSTIINIQLQ